jgi:ribosomal protein S18 acetylase RimI-like enzyme
METRREESVPLTWNQFGQVAEVLTAAFVDYPLIAYSVADDVRRRKATYALYAGVLRYTLCYGETYTTPQGEGAACWLPPDRPFPTFFRMLRSGMLAVPLRFGRTGFKRLQAADHVAEAEHRAHAPGPHWYLWVIGVDPARQGTGVAGRLMRPVFERADEAGLRCYLETHKASNIAVYERYGFAVVSQTSVPGHPLTVWAMMRRPNPGHPAG